jgi:hypothetical protein
VNNRRSARAIGKRDGKRQARPLSGVVQDGLRATAKEMHLL